MVAVPKNQYVPANGFEVLVEKTFPNEYEAFTEFVDVEIVIIDPSTNKKCKHAYGFYSTPTHFSFLKRSSLNDIKQALMSNYSVMHTLKEAYNVFDSNDFVLLSNKQDVSHGTKKFRRGDLSRGKREYSSFLRGIEKEETFDLLKTSRFYLVPTRELPLDQWEEYVLDYDELHNRDYF